MTRLSEAKVLLGNRHYSGAYYLAGYVVEFALKSCIAKQTRRHDFPDKKKTLDSWEHIPTALIKIAGLQSALAAEIRVDPVFSRNWTNVIRWDVNSRYAVNGEREAVDLVKAISDRRHGVLRWLRRHW